MKVTMVSTEQEDIMILEGSVEEILTFSESEPEDTLTLVNRSIEELTYDALEACRTFTGDKPVLDVTDQEFITLLKARLVHYRVRINPQTLLMPPEPIPTFMGCVLNNVGDE